MDPRLESGMGPASTSPAELQPSPPDPRPSVGRARHRILRGLGLSLGVFLFVLVLLEAAFRCLAPVEHRARASADWADQSLEVHRPSSVAGLEYELLPDLARESRYYGSIVHTNAFGLRGGEVSRSKPPGVFRVAAVGDSFTFGQGVADDEAFAHVLETLLDTYLGDPGRCEVLNFGVTGYSTRDEAAVVRAKVLGFEPDVVLLAYYPNDPEDHPDHPLHMAFHRRSWWEHSHLLRWIHGKLWSRALARSEGYIQHLHDESVDWPNVVQGFAEIDRATRAAGIPVVLAILPVLEHEHWRSYPLWTIHGKVAAQGAGHGFRVLDLGRRMQERRIPPRSILHEDGIHATAAGNRLFAEELGDFLAREFLQERALGGR